MDIGLPPASPSDKDIDLKVKNFEFMYRLKYDLLYKKAVLWTIQFALRHEVVKINELIY